MKNSETCQVLAIIFRCFLGGFASVNPSSLVQVLDENRLSLLELIAALGVNFAGLTVVVLFGYMS